MFKNSLIKNELTENITNHDNIDVNLFNVCCHSLL